MSASDSVLALPPSSDSVVGGGNRRRSRARLPRFLSGRVGAVAVVALGALALSGTTVVQASTVAGFPAAWVADFAQNIPVGQPGPNGGQCIAYARWAVNQAYIAYYGGETLSYPFPNDSYYLTWADASNPNNSAGPQLWGYATGQANWYLALDYAQKGDIVQLSPNGAEAGGYSTDPGWDSGGTAYQHTFILTANYSGSNPLQSTTPVIQSNWNGTGLVSTGTVGQILTAKSGHNLMIAVWQVGT